MSKIRRVVTGNDADGKSYIVADEMIEEGLLWRTHGAAPLGRAGDSTCVDALLPSTIASIEPAAGGSGFFFVTMPPWETLKPMFEQGREPGFDRDGFHRTATLDYLFVLDGEIELLLDRGTVLLRAGDVVVQRNTHHAWRNHTGQPVHLVASMVKLGGAA